MIKSLFFVALAPVVIIVLYIYIRDRYEKEPPGRLLVALLGGVIIIPAVLIVEKYLFLAASGLEGIAYHAFKAFIVASLTEEGFKYMAFYLLIWKVRDFNEKFDGIVYAVFISMGFAAVENLIYVYAGGYQVGLLRAFTAVPAHAFFGVSMGYHFGIARFYPCSRRRELLLAFLFPFIWHGFYDFFLMTGKPWLCLIFVPLLILLGLTGFRKMERLSDLSIYRVSGFGIRKSDD
jgi:protease PrsW